MDLVAEQPHRRPGQLFTQDARRKARLCRGYLGYHKGLYAGRGVADEKLSFVHQPDPVAPVSLIEVGGRDENGDSFGKKLIEDTPEVAARYGVDAIGRFIEKKYFGGMYQRTCKAPASVSFLPTDCLPDAA